MTTKHLTGAYPSGYTLASNVTTLVIESTASIGGTGIFGAYDMYALHITNSGTINATSKSGITIFQAGSDIVNGRADHAAFIEGSKNGISAANATVSNFGTIMGLGAGFNYAGVYLGLDSAVTNGSVADSSALVQGFDGIGGVWSTISNFGSVVGTGGVGVGFGARDGSNSVTVTNGSRSDHAANIQGARDGVFLRYTIATLTNWGTISGGRYDGVALLYGGLIDNLGAISATGASGAGIELAGKVNVINGSAQDTTASVTGVAFGITYTPTTTPAVPATVSNYGTVVATGASGYGVVLSKASHIRNGSAQDSSALIQGGEGGVLFQGSGATIVNFGTVAGGSAFGVSLEGDRASIVNNGVVTGGSGAGVLMSGAKDVLTNGSATNASALIGGGASVVSGAADTVVNFGVMSGLTLTAASDVLRVEAGCAFESPVIDAGTLALVNGVGTLGGLTGGAVVVSGSMAAATFSGFGTLGVGKAARFTVTGSAMIAAGQTLSDQGVLTVAGSLVVAGAAKGAGVIGLAAHATATFDAATPAALTVSFKGDGSVLGLRDPAAFAATIAGFNRRGKIDLVGVVATAAVLGAGDRLAITNGTTAVATLQLAGAFGGDTFAATSDGNGGTLITVNRTGANAPPASVTHPPHALIAAAAGLGASLGGAHAAPVVHPSHGRLTLAGPRAQIA